MTTKKKPGFSLDAARREREAPDEFPVTFKGQEFSLPGELPADVLDPFLSEEFNLPSLIEAVLGGDDSEGIGERVLTLLFRRPSLPSEMVDAFYGALELLFGEEQWAAFKALRPSIPDYVALTGGIFDAYGTTLGEVFASDASSVSGGPTSNQTSSDSTESTPETSGDDPEPAPAS